MKKIFQYIEDFWFLLYPHVCEACGEALYKNEEIVCLNCLYELPRTDYCFDPNNPIINLFTGRIKIEKATALFMFQKGSRFRKLLHNLKYNNKPEIGVLLGREMGAEMIKSNNFSDIDCIIPIPLHPKRKKQRGYNQSEMIAEGISQILKVPVFIDCVIRKAETTTQTRITKDERWLNVSGKFEITNDEKIKNKHILLVDDVVTTGSTIESCGESLLKIKDLKLSVAVLAKA